MIETWRIVLWRIVSYPNLNPKVGIRNMGGATPKTEEKQHLREIPLAPLRVRPLAPHGPSLLSSRPSPVPHRPAVIKGKPEVTCLVQIVQVDSTPLETMRNESTYLPNVA